MAKGFRGRAKHFAEVFKFCERTEALSVYINFFCGLQCITEFDTPLVAHDQVNAVGTGTVWKLENG